MENKFEDSITYQNLKNSFIEEACLYFKYKYFLSVAQYEGNEDVASYLKNLITSSEDNVLGTIDYIRNSTDPFTGVPTGNTEKNLTSLLHHEETQSKNTYPSFAEVARKEGLTDIASWFDTLEKTKRIHSQKYQALK